jgi:hypothetical protein
MRYYHKIEPSDALASDYLDILKSTSYRHFRAAEASNGKWPFPGAAMEMYLHFVKLAACGASDDWIKSMFTTLTTEEPVIPASTFAGLNGQNWRSYRGWISTGALDWGAFGIQNILATRRVYYPLDAWVWYHADREYIRENGYWQTPSSSCFAPDTLVVLADGTNKRIDEIRAGDEVLSPSGSGTTRSPRRVAFVSKPGRKGRPLYRFKGSAVEFTSTHPITRSFGSEEKHGGAPTLAFVDPGLAHALNPSWGAFEVHGIKPSSLELCFSRPQPGPEESILCDLVFEPDGSSSPALYVVTDGTGREMTVASEAPVSDIFPYSALFFMHFLPALGKMNDLDFLPEGLTEAALDYTSIFERAIKAAHKARSSPCEFHSLFAFLRFIIYRRHLLGATYIESTIYKA